MEDSFRALKKLQITLLSGFRKGGNGGDVRRLIEHEGGGKWILEWN